MAERTGLSARSSNWNSCPSRIFGSRWEATFAAHDIRGVPGFEDRRQSSWEGVSMDLRYRFLERDEAPFGLTFAVENHASRIDETTAAAVRSYGTEFTAAFDRELIPNVAVAALNLIYQPEWTRIIGTGAAEQEVHHRRRAGPDGAMAPGLLSRRGSALSAALRRDRSGGTRRPGAFCWPNRLFPIVEALTADRGLEHRRHGDARPDRTPRSTS